MSEPKENPSSSDQAAQAPREAAGSSSARAKPATSPRVPLADAPPPDGGHGAHSGEPTADLTATASGGVSQTDDGGDGHVHTAENAATDTRRNRDVYETDEDASEDAEEGSDVFVSWDRWSSPVGSPFTARRRRPDPDRFKLPQSYFDETELRRLTPVRAAAVTDLDPIVASALKRLAANLKKRFRSDADDLEETLSDRYLGVVEAVTERLNRRALPRITRLILSQRGIYAYLISDAIGRELSRKGNGSDVEHESPLHAASK